MACESSTTTESKPPAQSAENAPTIGELTERIEKRIVGGTLSELLYYLGLVQPGGVPVFEYDDDANPDQDGKPTTGFWCSYAIDSVKPGLKLEMIYRKVSIDGDGKSLSSSPEVDYVSLCVDIALVDDGEVVVSMPIPNKPV